MTDPTDRLRSLPAPLLRMAGALGIAELAGLAFQADTERAEQIRRLMSLNPVELQTFGASLGRHFAQKTVALPDGTTGYYERGTRTDDCFAACVATCLQVPIEEVPDPRIDERLGDGESAEEINATFWQQLAQWLAGRGLYLVAHERPPMDAPRWIGIVQFPGDFNDHSLVMSRGEVLFDPVDRGRYERPVRRYAPADAAWGISFAPDSKTSRR